jgi:hypothetical protein
VVWAVNAFEMRRPVPQLEAAFPYDTCLDSSRRKLPCAGYKKACLGELCLEGSDGGEWEGGLWLRRNAKARPEFLRQENILELRVVKDGILIITGLDHMGLNSGALFFWQRGDTELSGRLPLPGTPIAVVEAGDGEFLALTDDAVLSVRFNERAVTLIGHGLLWDSPNSMARSPDGRIAIGTNRFLSIWTPKHGAYTEQLFVKEDCRKVVMRDGQCRCS